MSRVRDPEWKCLTMASISDRTSPNSIHDDRTVNPAIIRIGGWLFRQRTAIPLPIAVAVLLLRVGEAPASPVLIAIGVAVTLAGEALRLWAVRHIGVVSRTRSERLGPLVASGPFAHVRNPLYVGNIALWVGFALTARLVWLAPVIALLLALEYHAIVRWEERLLEARIGDPYRDYVVRVPRWWPYRRERRDGGARREENSAASALSALSAQEHFTLSETLFSERGTLLAIAIGYVSLWIKARF